MKRTQSRISVKWTKRLVVELVAIAAMTAVVLILAFLQYRWTAEISRSEQARLKGVLASSVRDFDQEFSYDFERLCENLETDPEAPPATLEARIIRQYNTWKASAAYPGLVSAIDIWRVAEGTNPEVSSFEPEATRFTEGALPARLQVLQNGLARQASSVMAGVDSREALYYPWSVYRAVPALVRPIFQIAADSKAFDSSAHAIRFLVVELSRDFLDRRYFPDLIDRNFRDSGFYVAIRTASLPHQAVYSPNPDFSVASASPDAEVGLFDLVSEVAKRRGHAPLEASIGDGEWQLVAQHPAGSLEVAVAKWRRRNLLISFGLLAILAESMVLIFSLARRTERLARLQMEFVAGVSHELCTPLAVINSAAENLNDGIVEDAAGIRQYGGMIRDQGRRLERLVEQVLLFAAGRFGGSKYEIGPVQPDVAIEQSLAASGPLLREAGFTVETEIDAGLPRVMADPAAITKCVENLLSNAVKYSNACHWVGVRARAAPEGPTREVQIIVEDHGPGIVSADISHIFEPFYRVQGVRENQARGVGLGLYLVKQMMEGMGGYVSVSSEAGRGSSFVLHFASCAPDKQEPGNQT